jgi:hypothetical protein
MTTGRPATNPGGEPGRGGAQYATPRPPEAPTKPPEDRQEQDGTATWVQSTDATGSGRATREVPEPDSLGG